jgi:hypothetical protein
LVTPSNVGLQVEEERGPDQSIARLATARTAFVGRTLRGPVNCPVVVKNFSEFQHVFGGLWQPSPLGYAVEQFFDNGGREGIVVRVVNGARAATLTLNAGAGKLKLQALRPGTREFLRASVDYDNIPDESPECFNLIVQRVKAPGTAQVEDQEIFRRVSLMPGSEAFLPQALLTSSLVRANGALPGERPDRTLDPASGLATAYVQSNPDGDDGAPLCDYDLIGSELEHTGIFALGEIDYFNFLCVPPLSREQDVGPSALLVAARYCKERRAMLIVDPPAHWHTADDALLGLRDWELATENAVMYFPHILAHDKLRGHFEVFAPCGAVAGMLARSDEIFPLWDPERNEDAVLRPGYRPTCLVSDDRRNRLALSGVNTILGVRSASRSGPATRTLAAGSAGNPDWQYLSKRRVALYIVNCIERGTRWVAYVKAHAEVAERLTAQVRVFLESLFVAGAFRARRVDEAFFVASDQSNPASEAASNEFRFLIGFAATRDHQFHSYRISQSAAGTRVQPVSLNRLSVAPYSPAELEWVDRIAVQLEP